MCEVGPRRVAERGWSWRGTRLQPFQLFSLCPWHRLFDACILPWARFSPNLRMWSLANFCIPDWKLFHVFLMSPWSSTQQLKPLENVMMFDTTQPATQSTKVASSAEFGNIHECKQTTLYLCERAAFCFHCAVFSLRNVQSIPPFRPFETESRYNVVRHRLVSNSTYLLLLSPKGLGLLVCATWRV